jgi:hypothetical protein
LTNAEDSTPLHLSALIGNLEATKALGERGAPLNNSDNDGETPLFLAARCGTEIGTDINIHDIKSNTALHHAAIVMSKITGLVCWMDSKLKHGCLTLVPVMCYKYVGSITVLPAEIVYDRLTSLRQWYDTPGTLGDVGRNSY